MIVVIAFAEGKQRQQKRIARAASGRVRLTAESVTGRVDQERTLLKHDNSCHTANQKTSKRSNPSVPTRAEQSRQNKAHHHGHKMNMSMLPHHQRIFL